MNRIAAVVVALGASAAPGCLGADEPAPPTEEPTARVAECTIGQNLGEEWSANTQNITYACSTDCRKVKIVKTIYWYEGDVLKSRTEDPGCPTASFVDALQ